MTHIPTHASYLADVARAAHHTGKDLTLEEVAAVIEAVNSLGAADDTLARTGNTARDQEMYAAGRAVGEENAKHNAAIRTGSGWLPIESAPKDGTEIWAYNGEQARMRWVEGECYALWIWADDLLADADPSPEQPTYWQPVPAAPGVSTVEDAQAVGWMDPTTQDVISAERKASWLSEYGAGGAAKAATYTRALGDLRPAPAAGDALDALRELVECDNIKKRIASMQGCIPETEDDVQELDAMMSDLARRQPAAWDAARAALAAQRKGDA